MEKPDSSTDPERIENLIQTVMDELRLAGLVKPGGQTAQPPAFAPAAAPSPSKPVSSDTLHIDLPDPTREENRRTPGVKNPQDADGLSALMSSTTARIGAGRAGARFRTGSWLLFESDHAVTQDALVREVDPALLQRMNMFSVQTCITGGKEEYLLRPDLGRRLNPEATELIRQKCAPKPNIQICAGDGLSAAAIEANLEKIIPVMTSGFQNAGLTVGTPFFIRFCRVGVMNDIGDLLQPDVLILLIGERPGLGRADSMSAYMAYRPQKGHSDADRDVICNIYDTGGTNPLEAGAFVVQMARKMISKQASGIKLRLAETGKEK